MEITEDSGIRGIAVASLSDSLASSPPYLSSMPMLLALNCGSSSLKAALLDYPSLEPVASISASSIGSDSATLKLKRSGHDDASSSVKGESHDQIFGDILDKIQSEKLVGDVQNDIKIVTHRIVHGGTFKEPVLVTKDHTEALQKMEEVRLLRSNPG